MSTQPPSPDHDRHPDTSPSLPIVTEPAGITRVSAKPYRKKATKKIKKPRLNVMAIVCLVIGMVIALYPTIATLHNNTAQGDLADQLAAEMAQAAKDNPGDMEKELARGDKYNAALAAAGDKVQLNDPWATGQDVSHDKAYQHYLTYFDDFEEMGSISIPSINSQLPIVHGTSAESLDKGVGHMYGSSFPIGGPHTHAVLTGHTGLRKATMWDNLVKVKRGDDVFIEVYGRKLKYTVDNIEVVEPDDVKSLMDNNTGGDEITMITCTPYGVNTHRLLVHAKRAIEFDEKDTTPNSSNIVLQWWMWITIGISVLIIGYICYAVLRYLKKKKEYDALVARSKALA